MNPEFILYAFQAVGGAFCVVIWFLYKDVKSKTERTAQEFAAYKVHIAETYVTQSELTKAIDAFNRSIDAVFAKLDRIEDKLDHKQDKAK